MRTIQTNLTRNCLLAATATLLFATVTMFAPARAVAQEAVNVEVRVIQIRTQGNSLDPALEDLHKKLSKAFENYGTFRSLSRSSATIAPNQAHPFALPDGTRFVVSYQGVDKNLIRLAIRVGDKFKTNVRVSRGNTFFQAGLPHDGGILVIAVTAR